jgi:hypothetical protein
MVVSVRGEDGEHGEQTGDCGGIDQWDRPLMSAVSRTVSAPDVATQTAICLPNIIRADRYWLEFLANKYSHIGCSCSSSTGKRFPVFEHRALWPRMATIYGGVVFLAKNWETLCLLLDPSTRCIFIRRGFT